MRSNTNAGVASCTVGAASGAWAYPKFLALSRDLSTLLPEIQKKGDWKRNFYEIFA